MLSAWELEYVTELEERGYHDPKRIKRFLKRKKMQARLRRSIMLNKNTRGSMLQENEEAQRKAEIER